MNWLRELTKWLARTPLHPQWLMGPKIPPAGLVGAGGRVLDIGAADRWLQAHLDPEVQYVALDYPATGQVLYGARPDVFADAARLPFADGTFGAVACLEVLEHVRMPDQVLAEIARVLRPDGLAYVSMPFLYPIHDAPHDYQRWTPHGWRRSAELAGLEIRAMQPASNALQAAGLLTCLALAEPMQSGSPWRLVLGLPVLVLLIPLVNLFYWTMAKLWPSSKAITSGYQLELCKA